ncbi:hypothetical protein NYQ31_16350 [Curtobacterium flaccumfaciens]|uniref:hypothetical protein n=1 Tax=Curtobacterium TaxID=2034 RepID=UPI000DA87BF2|nr:MULTISPECIES: hypothetical protein [Curtobacterium]MCS6559971.1 hypothetical protein [Curtobacterium flaccumfaciens]WIE81733.1 hypothetical protein DEJ29_009900 [Curtobacterium sp. MCPF17_021]
MQVALVILGYFGSAAGATVLIAIGTGIARARGERRPRQRAAAIKAAAETRALLKATDELAIRAIEGHIGSEATQLHAFIDRENAAVLKRETRVPWRKTRLALAMAALGMSVLAFFLPGFGLPSGVSAGLTVLAGALAGASLTWTILASIETALSKRRVAATSQWLESTYMAHNGAHATTDLKAPDFDARDR